MQPGERVALMLPNRVEHVLADLGVVHAGGVPLRFYPTLAADQVGYVAGDCDARIAVLDGARELARWQPVLARLPGLKKIIVCDAGRPVRGLTESRVRAALPGRQDVRAARSDRSDLVSGTRAAEAGRQDRWLEWECRIWSRVRKAHRP